MSDNLISFIGKTLLRNIIYNINENAKKEQERVEEEQKIKKEEQEHLKRKENSIDIEFKVIE